MFSSLRPNKWSKANFPFQCLTSHVQYSMEKLACDLMLGSTFAELSILPTVLIYFLVAGWETLGQQRLERTTTIPPPPPPPPWLGHSLAKWPASPHLWQVLSPGTRAKWQKNKWYTSPLLPFLCSAHFSLKRRDHFTFIAVLCYVSWNFGGR